MTRPNALQSPGLFPRVALAVLPCMALTLLPGCTTPPPAGPDYARGVYNTTYAGRFATDRRYALPPGASRRLHPATANPVDPQVLADRWGFFADLAGNAYIGYLREGRTAVSTWRWIEPGLRLVEERSYPVHMQNTGIPIPRVVDFDVDAQALRIRDVYLYQQDDGVFVATYKGALLRNSNAFFPVENGYIERDASTRPPERWVAYNPATLEEYTARDYQKLQDMRDRKREFWDNVSAGTAALYQAADTMSREYAAQRPRASSLAAGTYAGSGAYGGDDVPVADQPKAPPPAARPLRFRLYHAMQPGPKAKNNPNCYSNVITTQAPPGYGHSGFDDHGALAKASRIVESYYPAFIAACNARADGEIRGRTYGTPSYRWNATDASEPAGGARSAEDVTVSLP